MVKRAAVPYIAGMDFRTEFYRAERDELDGFSFDEPSSKSRAKKEKLNRKREGVAKRNAPPLPIPPASIVRVGKPAKARKI